jgi:hypothetical protein
MAVIYYARRWKRSISSTAPWMRKSGLFLHRTTGALRADRETEPCIASYRNPLPFDPNATDLLESLLQNMAQ